VVRHRDRSPGGLGSSLVTVLCLMGAAGMSGQAWSQTADGSAAAGAGSSAGASTSTAASPAMAAQPSPAKGNRPRLELAIGMGATVDDFGFVPARSQPVPSFVAMAGVGAGPIGFDVAVSATTAGGRFRAPDAPIDRIGVDLLLVLRPAAQLWAGSGGFAHRIARSVAAEIGPGLEHAARGITGSAERFGLRTGVHFDFPLSAMGDPGELRLRLGARRFWGITQAEIGSDTVTDSQFQAYGALGVVF
jgi:hypothetical protein